jgi:hypothetical protein
MYDTVRESQRKRLFRIEESLQALLDIVFGELAAKK